MQWMCVCGFGCRRGCLRWSSAAGCWAEAALGAASKLVGGSVAGVYSGGVEAFGADSGARCWAAFSEFVWCCFRRRLSLVRRFRRETVAAWVFG
ncbi:hypothetical protein Droror1_Dr00025053 [Drosera rotundifolia]